MCPSPTFRSLQRLVLLCMEDLITLCRNLLSSVSAIAGDRLKGHHDWCKGFGVYILEPVQTAFSWKLPQALYTDAVSLSQGVWQSLWAKAMGVSCFMFARTVTLPRLSGTSCPPSQPWLAGRVRARSIQLGSAYLSLWFQPLPAKGTEEKRTDK